jgi:hypothetical protein
MTYTKVPIPRPSKNTKIGMQINHLATLLKVPAVVELVSVTLIIAIRIRSGMTRHFRKEMTKLTPKTQKREALLMYKNVYEISSLPTEFTGREIESRQSIYSSIAFRYLHIRRSWDRVPPGCT